MESLSELLGRLNCLVALCMGGACSGHKVCMCRAVKQCAGPSALSQPLQPLQQPQAVGDMAGTQFRIVANGFSWLFLMISIQQQLYNWTQYASTSQHSAVAEQQQQVRITACTTTGMCCATWNAAK
jgi:hypothetical protein